MIDAQIKLSFLNIVI